MGILDFIKLVRVHYPQFRSEIIDIVAIKNNEAMVSINGNYYFLSDTGKMLNLNGEFVGLCN